MKSPAFSYYPKDLLTDTAHLSAEQFGAYWRLTSYAWVGIAGHPQGYLPNDQVILAKLAGVDPRRWRSISPTVLVLFQQRDGLLFHKRLLSELENQRQKSASARESADKRWQSGRNASASNSDSERICERNAAGAVADEDEDAKRDEGGQGESFDPPLAAGFREAFEAWLATLPGQAAVHAKPTPDRRRKYEARRREGYPHALILDALRNYVHDDWEARTTNARARDMATLLRDGGQVEKFAAMRHGQGRRLANADPDWGAAVDAKTKPIDLGPVS